MPTNNYYNKRLKSFAHENRITMSKAEACLWKYALSKRQIFGRQFRRQRPVGKYIVDFVCLPLKLVVEVDGYSHQIPEREVQDRLRQDELQAKGFTVIRFKDEEVLTHINTVREVIEGWITKLEEAC